MIKKEEEEINNYDLENIISSQKISLSFCLEIELFIRIYINNS
jgi:hypothetical protein